MGNLCGTYSIKSLKQPYRCCAKCSIVGSITGVLCFVIGIIVLVYYGSGLKSKVDKERIPAFIGLGVFLIGLLCLIIGICFVVCLVRLFNRQQSNIRVYKGTAEGGMRSATASPSAASTTKTYSPVPPSAPSEMETIVPQDRKM